MSDMEIKCTDVRLDCERASSCRLPNVLLVIIVLGDDCHLVSHQVGRVETHTKLTNHGDVGSSLQSLHESLGAGLCDCTQVVDQVGLGHADARVNQGQGAFLFVGNDFNFEVLARIKLGGFSETLIAYFVQSLEEKQFLNEKF